MLIDNTIAIILDFTWTYNKIKNLQLSIFIKLTITIINICKFFNVLINKGKMEFFYSNENKKLLIRL
jgi:hypothetical protein